MCHTFLLQITLILHKKQLFKKILINDPIKLTSPHNNKYKDFANNTIRLWKF